MKTQSKKKRFLINLMAILVILAVGVTAAKVSTDSEVSFDPTDTPSLKVMKIIDLKIRHDPQGDAIRVALVPSSDSVNFPDLVKDVVTTYEWGNKHFAPAKCGEIYPKDLCKVGIVEVWLLAPLKNVPKEGVGKVTVYQVMIKFGLDQIQIEQKLMQADLMTVDDLVNFHKAVVQETEGTGGMIKSSDSLEVFVGFK